MRKEILEITRTQQYMDSQPVPMHIGVHPKSKGKGKDSKDKGKSKDAKGRSKGKDAEKVLLLSGDRSHTHMLLQRAEHV